MERKIEDAVAGLLAVDTDIVAMAATVKTAYEMDKKVKALSVVVKCAAPVNANIGATGGGAYWRAEVILLAGLVVASDTTMDSLDRTHGACQRFLAALSVASLNTALSGITVHGKSGTDQPAEEMDEARERLTRSSSIVLHYAVS
jgi:hypothetical protein